MNPFSQLVGLSLIVHLVIIGVERVSRVTKAVHLRVTHRRHP